MEFNKLSMGAVALACVLAGAGAAYLVNSGGEPESAVGVTDSVAAPSIASVEQSEGVLTEVDEPEPVTSPAAPAVAPAPRRAARPAAAPVRPASRTQPAASAAPAPAPAVPVAQSTPSRPDVTTPVSPEPVRRPTEIEPPAAPPAPQFVDLTIPAESVLGLQMETSHNSEDARVEDEVVARVTRDVRVGDRVAIPAGSKAYGEVVLVERGGRLRDRARLGVRFTSVVLADGTRIPVDTEAVYREGDARGSTSAAKIGGGAIGGAIIGGILGGAKGAAIGGSVGAGAGSAAVLAGGRSTATLPTGTPVTVRVETPTTVTVEN
jgi:hypothetical protein